MPSEPKPLFRADALRPKLVGFSLAGTVGEARQKLAHWVDLLASKKAEAMKETELLPLFITDLFERLLGFTGPASGEVTYTLKREALISVDGKYADAALGRFAVGGEKPEFIAVVEGKGPRDPLDRPFGGRKLSAVDQALRYAVNLLCDWYLVTNLHEVRVYHKGHDQFTYERFETAALIKNEAALRKLVYLLGAERLAPAKGLSHLHDLLADSERIGLDLTRDYYQEYSQLRREMFNLLRLHNKDIPSAQVLGATQKILDRVLFIAFCEDRGLLPQESISQAYRHTDPYNPRPIWDNFRGLFKAIDQGSPPLKIEQYNGGLFAHDDLLDRLMVPDAVCKGLDRLAAYEYRPPVLDDEIAAGAAPKFIDVEILGHIFEQSISDLEQLHQEIARGPAAEPAKAGPSRRKQEGAFYTPNFITRYIVSANSSRSLTSASTVCGARTTRKRP
jgi:hypothetical protein